MTHTGYGITVEAASEAEAAERGLAAMEAERPDVQWFEVPLHVEDLGDGLWDVVLRKRIALIKKAPVADRPFGLPVDMGAFGAMRGGTPAERRVYAVIAMQLRP